MDIQQKNSLLSAFLSTFGIREDIIKDYAINNNIDNYQELVSEFNNIKNSVFDCVWKITEPNKQIFQYEIETICATYCFEHYQWINEVGLKALTGWLLWMCWHEGILKEDNQE